MNGRGRRRDSKSRGRPSVLWRRSPISKARSGLQASARELAVLGPALDLSFFLLVVRPFRRAVAFIFCCCAVSFFSEFFAAWRSFGRLLFGLLSLFSVGACANAGRQAVPRSGPAAIVPPPGWFEHQQLPVLNHRAVRIAASGAGSAAGLQRSVVVPQAVAERGMGRAAARRSRSICTSGRRRTAGRFRSCWKSAACRTMASVR